MYKKELSKRYRQFHQNLNKKFRNLKQSDPKSYWSLLNKYSNEKKKFISDITSEVFFEHFSKLNEGNADNDESFDPIDLSNISEYNSELNKAISNEEISVAINGLNNNKACSVYDNILNEYIKHSKDMMLPVLNSFFNLVLNNASIPDIWCKGIIFPIYKQKGDINNPDNYRGITILSCFGKLFTAILNNRLNKFLEDSGILGEEQAGFRKKYSTVDHIFTLKMLVDFYVHKLYCSFIDYRKAFDSVNRLAMWKKLLQNNIDGKVFKVIYSLYEKAKSCVRSCQGLSSFFVSCNGVRQGENLSPILFSIFLNDLVQHMSGSFDGLECLSNSIRDRLSDDTIYVYLKLYLLLYADDTVVFAESAADLQLALNSMHDYCNIWKLEVNIAKTKVVVFSKGKIRNIPAFTYGGLDLDVVDDFSYLGVKFNYNGKFNKTKKYLCDQARKAMFSVFKKARKLCLSLDLQLHLFDSMISPILLYGSEVWGCENVDIINQFQLKYCKMLLKLKKSTPNIMIYGELGRMPMDCIIKSRVLNYWCRLVNSKEDKICHIMYKLMYELDKSNVFHSPWIGYVKNSLDQLGFSEYWLNQNVPPQLVFSNIIKSRIKDIYIQDWNTTIYQQLRK